MHAPVKGHHHPEECASSMSITCAGCSESSRHHRPRVSSNHPHENTPKGAGCDALRCGNQHRHAPQGEQRHSACMLMRQETIGKHASTLVQQPTTVECARMGQPDRAASKCIISAAATASDGCSPLPYTPYVSFPAPPTLVPITPNPMSPVSCASAGPCAP